MHDLAQIVLTTRNETSGESPPFDDHVFAPPPKMADRRAEAIAPRVHSEAIRRMADLFRLIESQRCVVIPAAIRHYLGETVLESLYLDAADWRRLCNADPQMDADAEAIGSRIEKSLILLLANAEAQPRPGRATPRITFIGVLRSIHEHWCGIFPFCREKPSPPANQA